MTDMNPAWAFAAGALLGGLFFGGLWWTARKGLPADNPALWFVGSWLLRTSLMWAGFYFVAGGDWRRTLACLFGFICARQAVLRLAHTSRQQPLAAMEARNES